ncbi:dual specificity protein phosphatase 10 [Biomphalaria pfeifferi]|uniref:Dual specificity protein phosphatase 10 n=1 Tax=Biomphalaria pfeifferi TaxID=112525 RepID=A0AAD8F5C2_BIOPF|nr:dual specificity protein phosphatase 10 [Biomphalaria pfeifferi]
MLRFSFRCLLEFQELLSLLPLWWIGGWGQYGNVSRFWHLAVDGVRQLCIDIAWTDSGHDLMGCFDFWTTMVRGWADTTWRVVSKNNHYRLCYPVVSMDVGWCYDNANTQRETTCIDEQDLHDIIAVGVILTSGQ